MNILILGGTAEARALANRLVALGHAVTSSLAGRTQSPLLPAGQVRIGGFGGVDGLAHFLRQEGIDRLVDVTHPYAATISRNAVAATRRAGVPLLRVLRPAWEPQSGTEWICAGSAEEAAATLPRGATVLLTTGHTGLEHFTARTDCRFLVRLIEPAAVPLPLNMEPLLDRPPYTLSSEMALLERHSITHLVSKNSGGGQTAAKLEAAAKLGVPVIMIARPIYDPAPEVASVEEALSVLLAG